MKVLITAPSLDENENISGISTVVAGIIKNADFDFVHFGAGRKDGARSGLKWIAEQVRLPFEFKSAIARANPDVIHINTAFEPRAIIRDLVLAKSAGKRPIVLHVHGGRYVMEDFHNGLLASLARRLLSSASKVVTLGENEAERINAMSPGIDAAVIP